MNDLSVKEVKDYIKELMAIKEEDTITIKNRVLPIYIVALDIMKDVLNYKVENSKYSENISHIYVRRI